MRLKAPDRNHQIVTQRQQSGRKVFRKRPTAKCKLGQTSVKGRPSFAVPSHDDPHHHQCGCNTACARRNSHVGDQRGEETSEDL